MLRKSPASTAWAAIFLKALWKLQNSVNFAFKKKLFPFKELCYLESQKIWLVVLQN